MNSDNRGVSGRHVGGFCSPVNDHVVGVGIRASSSPINHLSFLNRSSDFFRPDNANLTFANVEACFCTFTAEIWTEARKITLKGEQQIILLPCERS
jgi:hypothetical protein